MPLSLLHMEHAELPVFFEILWQTMRDVLYGFMYPSYTEATQEYLVRRELGEWLQNPEQLRMMKVVDTNLPDSDPLGKIVGVSKWNFHLTPPSPAETRVKQPEGAESSLPPGVDVEFREKFSTAISKAKQDIIGDQPYMLLNLLATRPNHERRGVGTMQLQWGLAEADMHGVPVYLESSQMGEPLYERWGFRQIYRLPFDARPWNAHDCVVYTCMIRPTKSKPSVGDGYRKQQSAGEYGKMPIGIITGLDEGRVLHPQPMLLEG